MKSAGIEDISIDNSIRNENKNGKGFIIVFLLILLIIFIVLIILSKYFLQKPIQTKELFFDSLSNFNLEQVIDDDFYKSVFKRVLNENSTIDNQITYTSNRDIAFLKDFNLDKISVNSTISTNISDDSFFNKIKIDYSGNEFLKFNLLSNNKDIGIMSDSIVNKYIGLSYDKLDDLCKINNPIKSFKELDDINISETELKKSIKKYIELISNQISEDKFSYKDNIILDNSFDNISVKEYKLELSNDELKTILKSTLTELKNDEELLNHFLSTSKKINIEIRANNGEKNIVNEPNEVLNSDEDINNESTLNNDNNGNIEINEENGDSVNTENTLEENQAEISLEPNISISESILPEGAQINFDELQDSENIKLEDIFSKIIDKNTNINSIINILFNKKINKSLNSFQNDIDEIINKIDYLEGNGITLKLYVNENDIKKVVATLPNDSDLELEFHQTPEHNNTCKLTYLYFGENGKFSFSNDFDEEYISLDKIDNVDDNIDVQNKKNGFSIELSRKKGDSQNSLGIIYNFIENEIINKKIIFTLNSTGNINSNTIKNELLLRNSGIENDDLIIESVIKFNENEDVQELSDDNLLLLDELSEEEINEVIQTIKYQINKVREEKKYEAEVIDTNNQKYIIDRNFDNISSNVTYEEAKNALIEKISSMMRESIEKNEEFTLLNLENLTIDGYNVSTNVSEENATIVIDVYTFSINSNFELTDA